MRYVLIMQLIFDGYRAGGASVEAVEFDNIEDCRAVKEVFLTEMKESIVLTEIYRQAKCVEIGSKK